MYNPAPWTPRSPEKKELHEINRRVESLKIELNRTSNSLEKQNLPKVVLKSIKAEMKFLQEQIEKLEQEARKIINDNPDLKLKFDTVLIDMSQAFLKRIFSLKFELFLRAQ